MLGLPIRCLLEVRAWGMDAVQATHRRISSAPSISPFSSIHISILWSSLLYLLAVSQRPHIILKQVGAGLHIPFGVWPFLSHLSFLLHDVIGHVPIPRTTVVYSSIIKLLFTVHQSQRTYTQQENRKFCVYRLTSATRKGYDMT